MKTELQEPRPWINSRHQAHVDEEIQTNISERAWQEVVSLQDEADTAIAGCLFLGGMLVMILLVGYIMWVNNLIVH
ncbi:hypothetical protein [uncultured Megasphaera sp.]|uniref:hypothetical protein n=1 Tax=uncultured Megasphaera sp. TaxID=165188 RepID=UPI00258D20C3|nr:hypothetical protein [uncultured Megasphaera sp.]